jgi:hypothetical protein
MLTIQSAAAALRALSSGRSCDLFALRLIHRTKAAGDTNIQIENIVSRRQPKATTEIKSGVMDCTRMRNTQGQPELSRSEFGTPDAFVNRIGRAMRFRRGFRPPPAAPDPLRPARTLVHLPPSLHSSGLSREVQIQDTTAVRHPEQVYCGTGPAVVFRTRN